MIYAARHRLHLQPSELAITVFIRSFKGSFFFPEALYKIEPEMFCQDSRNTYLRHSNPSASIQEVLHVPSAFCHCKFRLQRGKGGRHTVLLIGWILEVLYFLFKENSS